MADEHWYPTVDRIGHQRLIIRDLRSSLLLQRRFDDPGLPAQWYLEAAEKDRKGLTRGRFQCTFYWDREFPPQLREIYDPPVVLYYRGKLPEWTQPLVAIVGTRHPTGQARECSYALAFELGTAGLTTVSGLARGIDAEAHMGSLSASGATIIVLGCGIRRYRPPNALRELATPESTLFLSELPPKQTWDAGGAMGRNRIVCGLASAIVIVESQESGGTVHAAKKAFELGRPVFVIQFDEYDERSAGNPQLLRLGARPLKAHFDPDDRTWRVDIDPVVDAVEKGADASSQPDQMDLLST